MDENMRKFAAAIRQAAVPVDLGGSPNGSTQDIVNLQNLAQGQFKAAAGDVAAAAAGADANIIAENEKRAEEAARQKRMSDIKDRLDQIKEENDPKNYQQVPNDHGGYDFYNGKGEKIDVKEYAQATKKRVSDLLKDSEDPADREFVDNYKQLKELGDAMINGDSKKLKSMYDADPRLQDKLKGKTYNDVVMGFKRAYPQFFSAVNSGSESNVGNMVPNDVAQYGARVNNPNLDIFNPGTWLKNKWWG